MINFIFWPAASFFDRKLYGYLGRSSFQTGFFYLAYLALILAFVFTAAFAIRLKPDVDEFVAWWRRSFPGITLTPQGVESPVPQPYYLVHPKWGIILIVDTGRIAPNMTEMDKTAIYLTKTKAFAWTYKKRRLRSFDLVPPLRKLFENWNRRDFTLTGENLLRFYESNFFLFTLLFFVLIFWVLFVWKVYAAFFYSLIALLINRFRSSRFWYPGLFSISCLALTPVAVLQVLQVIGNFRFLNVFWATAVTAGFLAFALAGGPSRSEKA